MHLPLTTTVVLDCHRCSAGHYTYLLAKMLYTVLFRLWSTLVRRLARSCPGLDVLRRAKQLWSLLLTATSRLFGSAVRPSSGLKPDLAPIGDAPALPPDPRPMANLAMETSTPISGPAVVLYSDDPHSQPNQHTIDMGEELSNNVRTPPACGIIHRISDEEY